MAELTNNIGIRFKDTAYGTMRIEDGIFFMSYKSMQQLDITIALQIVQDRLDFIKGVSHPSLFDIRKVKNSTKEARDYMANEGNELVKASAILIDSPLLRMMANFYISVNKPKNPTQMFTDEKHAIKWLQQFKSR